MDTGLILLGLSQKKFTVLFDQIRITHPHICIIVIQHNLRLRPDDLTPVRGINLHASTQPDRVAIVVRTATSDDQPVGSGLTAPQLTNKMPAVIMEPVEIFTVAAFPCEIGSARVFNQPTIGIAHITGRLPCMTPITAVTFHRITGYGSIDAIKGAIAEHRVTLLFSNRTAPRRRTQAGIAIR